MREKLTDVEAFQLGGRVAAILIRKGIATESLPVLLKAEAEDVLSDVRSGADPVQLAERLYSVAPPSFRENSERRREGKPAHTVDGSIYDRVRAEQAKANEPLNKGSSAADRLSATGGR